MDARRMRRIEAVGPARQKWLDAIDAKMDHGTVNRFWESYVALARLAGVKP